MTELGVSFVETVLLSLSMFETEEEITVDLIRPYWQVLEDLVGQERILSIGIADLDKKKLEELYDWAKVRELDVALTWKCINVRKVYSVTSVNDVDTSPHSTRLPLKYPIECQKVYKGSFVMVKKLN